MTDHRYTLFLRFDTEQDAINALGEFRLYDGDFDRWSWDGSRISAGYTVEAPLQGGYWVNILYNTDDLEIATYEALPQWIATAQNGFETWTVIRTASGFEDFVPQNVFA